MHQKRKPELTLEVHIPLKGHRRSVYVEYPRDVTDDERVEILRAINAVMRQGHAADEKQGGRVA